jgi:hypothetical protein
MSLAKDVYDATARLKKIARDAQYGTYGDQTVTREAIKKLMNEARNLSTWLSHDARQS